MGKLLVGVMAALLPSSLAKVIYCDQWESVQWERLGLARTATRQACEDQCNSEAPICAAISYMPDSSSCALLIRPEDQPKVFMCSRPQLLHKRFDGTSCPDGTILPENQQDETTMVSSTKVDNVEPSTTSGISLTRRTIQHGIQLTTTCPPNRICPLTTCDDLYWEVPVPGIIGWSCPGGAAFSVMEDEGKWTKLSSVQSPDSAVLFPGTENQQQYPISGNYLYSCPTWDQAGDESKVCVKQPTC